MSYVYQWTTDDDEIALDAVMVGLGSISTEMLLAGIPYTEAGATIYWSAWFGPKGQVINADWLPGPFSVPDALEKAHYLCEHFGFRRVVVLMETVAHWNDDWGQLAEMEGLG